MCKEKQALATAKSRLQPRTIFLFFLLFETSSLVIQSMQPAYSITNNLQTQFTLLELSTSTWAKSATFELEPVRMN